MTFVKRKMFILIHENMLIFPYHLKIRFDQILEIGFYNVYIMNLKNF